jgi:hypothetical protein
MTNLNHQQVVLETYAGTARDSKQLKKAWQSRLKEIAPHYRVISARIIKKRDLTE